MRDRLAAAAAAAPLRAGRSGRELGARIDLVASTGVRQSLRRMLQEPRLRALRDEVYEELWGEAAVAIGATVVRRPSALLEIRLDGQRTWVYHQEVALDHAMTLRVSLEKSLAHELLTEVGIPVPQHAVCDVRRLAPAIGSWPGTPRGSSSSPPAAPAGGSGSRPASARSSSCAGRCFSPRASAPRAGGGAGRRQRAPAALPRRRADRHRPPRAPARRRRRPGLDARADRRENMLALQARGRACPSFLTITLDCVFDSQTPGWTSHRARCGSPVRSRRPRTTPAPPIAHRPRALAPEAWRSCDRAVAATNLRLAGVDLSRPT